MKKKIFIDIIMFIVFIILMFFNITGMLLHEILGILIFVLALIHIYLNRKFLFGIKLTNPNINSKIKFKFILDWLLLIGLLAITITGVGSSPDIFSFINFSTGKWHLYLSYVELFFMLIHFGLNLKLVYKVLKVKNINFAITSTIFIFIALFSYLFYKDFLKKEDLNNNILDDNQNANENSNFQNNTQNNNENVVIETLAEYLGKLRCDGCGRHCLLIAPQCGIGVAKAEQATVDYYEKYGITETSNSISYKSGDYELIVKL